MREHCIDSGFGSECGLAQLVNEICVSKVRGQSVARLTVLIVKAHRSIHGRCGDGCVLCIAVPDNLQWDNVVCRAHIGLDRVANRSERKLVATTGNR